MRDSTFTLLLVLCLFTSCQVYQHPQTITNKSQPVGEAIDANSSPTAQTVAETIAPYQERLSAEMQEVIGQINVKLNKARPESSLGNWMADLLQTAAVDIFPDVDVAFSVQNYGGIRVGELASGPLEVGEIYELMPFDNQMVLVEANGFVVQELIQHMAAAGGWPVSAELRYQIQDGKAVNINIKGAPIELNRNYYFSTSDYVANGGSDASMLTDRPKTNSGLLVRDLLVEYCRKQKAPIAIKLDGRVSLIE